MARELPIPAAAVHDGNSFELVRVWAAAGEQHVSIATEIWEDPGAWGILLVDLARHVARAYEQTADADRREVFRRIREAFDVEWTHPTDMGSGSIVS
jgi:hypothetical protein